MAWQDWLYSKKELAEQLSDMRTRGTGTDQTTVETQIMQTMTKGQIIKAMDQEVTDHNMNWCPNHGWIDYECRC